MSRVAIEYEKLPYQEEFHEATEAYDILSAGYGAGKTYSLCMKALRLSTLNFGLPAGILCPDLKMFKRDVLPTFEQIAEKNQFKIKFRQAYSELLIYPSKTKCMVFHSEDEGRSIRGPNLAWGIVNEVTLCSKAAFDAFDARIRLKQAALPQIEGETVGIGDMAAQAEQVFHNLHTILAAHGATFAHVIKATIYLTDMARLAEFNAVRTKYYGTAKPASALIGVTALVDPGWMIEVELVALTPAQLA